MKLLSEEKLLELLEKAYEQGADHAEAVNRGAEKQEDWDERCRDSLNQLIENV